jgi:uncharacterized protein (DUF2147 family)
MAMLPKKVPVAQQMAEAESPRLAGPAPAGADERAAPRAPAPVAVVPGPATQPKAAVPATGPFGVWVDHTGRGAVEITECSSGLCGRIVWLQDAGHKSVCGTQIIGDAKKTSPGTWDGGWIYDPETKNRYSVEIKTSGSDKLRVMGYQGSKMFSQTFTWKRPSGELKRCDQDAPVVTASPAPAAKPKAEAEEPAKAEPTPEPETKGARKSGNPNLANLANLAEALKFQKRQVNGKWQCTVKAPYVGTVAIRCPD